MWSKALCTTCLLLAALASGCAVEEVEAPLKFDISIASSIGGEPRDGRIILVMATDDGREPRLQVSSGIDAPQIFGVDVEGFAVDDVTTIDAEVFGYPHESLATVPPGEYWVQAVLHEYETFSLSTGHTVKLPMDRGEGQHWNRAPGNLYSEPKKLQIDPGARSVIPISKRQEGATSGWMYIRSTRWFDFAPSPSSSGFASARRISRCG